MICRFFKKTPLWLLFLIFFLITIFMLAVFGYPWASVKNYCKETIYEQIIKETYRSYEGNRFNH